MRVDGSVACWGDDKYGQATPPEGEFASVSAGRGHTCGVRVDGSVAYWGGVVLIGVEGWVEVNEVDALGVDAAQDVEVVACPDGLVGEIGGCHRVVMFALGGWVV